ncbi:MAG TPA: hypothetical protein PKW07_03925 [Syntrophorhabdaceae bacterium]|nr:hypothetical protein [Syntrophorhabdaceae bacterium]
MKTENIKAIIFFAIAGIFLLYAFYSGGDIKTFLSVVIFFVCGFMGFLYLKGKKEENKKKKIKRGSRK